MSEKELQDKYSILLQQLELINRYTDHFEEMLGVVGRKEKINQVLDEIILVRKKLQEFKSKKDKL